MIQNISSSVTACTCKHYNELSSPFDNCVNHILLQRQKSQDCEFFEELDRSSAEGWNTYYSVQHPNNTEKTVKWYIALNRHGKTRIAMTAKHKSSRFKTQATHSPEGPTIPNDMNIFKRKNYRRLPNKGRSRPHRPKVRHNDIRPAQRQHKSLSDILSSIEKVLAEGARTANSEKANFRDSMLIDLGGNNPFLNIDTGDSIRHPINKFKRRRNYRRKPSRNSNHQ